MTDRLARGPAAVAHSTLCVAAWLIAFAAVWLPDLPAGRDIPAHAMAAAVWANPEAFSAWLVPNVPMSGTVYPLFSGLVAKVTGVVVALKVGLTMSLVVCGFGLGRLARVSGADPRLASVVGLCIGCGWLFGMGFTSFVIGTGVALFAASFAFEEQPRLRIVSALFLVAVWCHLMAAGIVFGSVLVARTLARRRVPSLRWLVAWVPGIAVALTVGLGYVFGQSDAGAPTGAEWGTLSGWFRDLALTSLTSFDVRLGLPAGIGVAAVSLALTVRAWTRPMVGPADAFLRGTALWWVLLVVTPLDGLGWAFARPRLMPVAVLIPLAMHARATSRQLLSITGLLVLGLVGALVGSLERGRQVGDVVLELRSEEPSGETFLVSYLDLSAPHDGPYVQPFVAVAAYGMLNGGVARHLFAHNPAAHSMLYRDDLELPDAVPQFIHLTEACVADSTCSGGPQVRADRLALAGLSWDSISIAGLGHEERALLLDRGYRQLAPGLLQARPSRIRITADVPADLAEFPVVVRYGYPTTGVIGGETVTGTRGRVELELGPVVAGPTVLEVFFDRDGDGVPSAADVAVFESPRLSVLVPPGDVLELGH